MVNKVPYFYIKEKNRADAWQILDVLLRNGYTASVEEEMGAIIIRYNNINPEIADFYLEWLNEEEADCLDSYRLEASEKMIEVTTKMNKLTNE